MSTKILITGATGTNGREILKQLTAAGHQVRAMVRNLEKAADLQSPNVELVEGDFDKPDTLEDALRGIEKAFVVTPVDARHVEWMRNFIEAAKRAATQHVVKFSGMGAKADSDSEIIRMHAQTDDMLKQSGLSYTILQPNSFFQNMFWSANTIKEQGAFYLPMGDAKQSVIDVRDIAAIAVKVLTESGHEGKTYVLTGPEPLTYHDIAQKIAKAIGKPVNYVPVPVEAARKAMADTGMPAWLARVLAEFQGVVATGAYAATTNEVANLLGREPTSFDDFIATYADFFK